MKTSFIAHALLLRDLCDRRLRFHIPLYQRPYSWTIDEATRLLDDLVNSLGEDAEKFDCETYFLGAIILTGTNQREDGSRSRSNPSTETFRRLLLTDFDESVKDACGFDIVDGKQRLITLLIILCLLRDLSPESERPTFTAWVGSGTEANPFRLQLSGGEHDFFIEHVLTSGSTTRDIENSGLPNSQKNIWEVRDNLRDMLSNLGEDQRRRLLGYILDHCEIVIILSRAFDDAFQIFLSINDTGTRLVQGDILKVDLMTRIDRPLRKQYINIWESWNDSLGEPETRHGVRKTFFNHFWYALTGAPSNMLADIRALVDKSGGAIPFIDDYLVPHASAYRLLKSKEWPHEENKQEMNVILGVLDWLSHDDWVSAAMLAITTFERQRKETPQSKEPHDWILAFFRQLERFGYALMIQGNSAYNRRKRYNPVRRGLRDAGSGIDPIEKMDLSTADIRAIRGILSHGLHRNRSQAAKLVLMRIEQHASGLVPAYYNELSGAEALSVEHLLPRSPREGSRWLVDFPDPKERAHAAELLGNLFLVRESDNLAMKNYDFPIKHEVLFKDKGPHPVKTVDELRPLKGWLRSDIDARQQRMMDIATTMWRL